MLLTKRKINGPVKNFLSIFARNGQSNLVLVLVLVLESKVPTIMSIGPLAESFVCV